MNEIHKDEWMNEKNDNMNKNGCVSKFIFIL